MRLRSFVLAAVAVLLLGGSARADFVYEFAQGGTFGNSFSVNQGSTIAIQVYLAQQNGSTNLTNPGLVDGGVSLNFSATSPFTISSTSNISPNSSQFAGPNTTSLSTSSGTTTATVQVHNSSPVVASTTDASGNAVILLGTFTFTGSTPGSGNTLTALPDPSSNNNVDGNNVVLDSMIHNSTAAITVVAVPEPGSLLLAGLAAAGFAGGAWRRRRQRLAATAAQP
jgi:hypothetical protein